MPRIVLFNVHFYPDSFGGATIVCEETAHYLKEQGWDVLVITSTNTIHPYTKIRYKVKGIDVFSIGLPNNLSFKDTYYNQNFADIAETIIDDFKPGENVFIHGSNFIPNSYIEINLTRPDGEIEIAPYGRFVFNYLPLTDVKGDFSFYLYDLNGIEGEYFIQASDGENYANVIFYDSSIWTTDNIAQQKNSFISGEPVGIDGEGISTNAHLYYEVRDKTSGGNNVSWGWIDTDSNGEIVFTIIWEIPLSYSNIGQHKVYVYDTQTKTKTFSIKSIDLIDNDNDGYYAPPHGEDCDDTDPNTYPGAQEICDGKDNDCDDVIPADETDDDGDGYSECEGDCDDNDSEIYPGASEICDGKDNDCDDVIPTEEIDNDGDGFSECEGDCDDNDSYTYPGAPEQCDGDDNDCDGTIEDEEIDNDGDDYTPCQGDCDDTDPNTYPGAPELYDGKDNDCDGEIEINSGAQFGNPKPSDGSKNNPLIFSWSIQINDTETGIFDWNISCSNGQYNSAYEDQNGTKTLQLSGLSYSKTYTIWVKTYDYNSWNNKSYKFTTKGKSIDSNIPPVAIIEGLLIGFPGESIDFTGSKSYDTDGFITSYNWNLDDGAILNGENISHIYSNSGSYNITLTVFDNNGAKNSTKSNVIIIKGNNPPELNISILNIPGNLSVNLTITVTDRDGDNLICTIDWDDKTIPKILDLTSNQSITETHIYESYDTYEIYVSADDGSTITSESKFITLTDGNKKEDKNNTNGKGNGTSNIFKDIIENNEPFDELFLDNKIDSRSILGDYPTRDFAKIIATILSIILLFLLNYLIEFFSDYFSEKTIDYRRDWKSRLAPTKAFIAAPVASAFLSFKEIFAIIASTLILSFVLTWTWVPDLSMFLETFVVFILIILVIIFIREALRGLLCSKLKFQSEFYIWPLGAFMMFVSTAIGNTFSLAANHHYKEEDLKKCGKVSFIVSIVIYIILAIAFLFNLYYPSTILQMIIIVSILNLFIDMFPLNPMDGYEVRHWNIYLWLCFYIIILISYIVVYFNIYP